MNAIRVEQLITVTLMRDQVLSTCGKENLCTDNRFVNTIGPGNNNSHFQLQKKFEAFALRAY